MHSEQTDAQAEVASSQNHQGNLIAKLRAAHNVAELWDNTAKALENETFIVCPQGKQRPGLRPDTRVYTYGEIDRMANKLANYLTSLGVTRGECAMILSANNPPWIAAMVGMAKVGLALVTPYPTMGPEEVRLQSDHSRARVVIAENDEQIRKLDLNSPNLLRVIALTAPKDSDISANPKVITMLSVLEDPTLSEKFSANGEAPDSSAKLVQMYTSGSSGVPKGVELTHGQMLASIRQAVEAGLFRDGNRLSGVLYLSHILPLLKAYIATTCGLEIHVPKEPDSRARKDPISMGNALKFGDVDVAVLTPQILARINNGLDNELRPRLGEELRAAKESASGKDGAGFNWRQYLGSYISAVGKEARRFVGRQAREIAITKTRSELNHELAKFNKDQEQYNSERVAQGLPPLTFRAELEDIPLSKRIKAALFGSFVGDTVSTMKKAALGAQLKEIVSGGSALPRAVAIETESLGLEVIEGYGATELAGASHCQRPNGVLPGYIKVPGTVGPPLPGVEQYIDPVTKELLVSGETVMSGYSGDPDKTAQAIEIRDGKRWYHTGDMVEVVDRFGSIRIVGRLDRMYKNLGGEKISPELSEKLVLQCPLVGYAVMCGAGQTKNVVIISPSDEAKTWADARGIEFESLSSNSDFQKEIMSYIDREVNGRALKGQEHQQIRQVIVAPQFTKEAGLITDGLKVRPKFVIEKYGKELREAFGQGGE